MPERLRVGGDAGREKSEAAEILGDANHARMFVQAIEVNTPDAVLQQLFALLRCEFDSTLRNIRAGSQKIYQRIGDCAARQIAKAGELSQL